MKYVKTFEQFVNESVNESKSVKVGDFIKTEYGYYYKRVAGKVGGREAFIEIMNGKYGKRKTSLHSSTKFEVVDAPDDLKESVNENFGPDVKVGDKVVIQPPKRKTKTKGVVTYLENDGKRNSRGHQTFAYKDRKGNEWAGSTLQIVSVNGKNNPDWGKTTESVDESVNEEVEYKFDGIVKISGNLYNNWNDREIQKFLKSLKSLEIIGDLNNVLTIRLNDKDIKSFKKWMNESVNENIKDAAFNLDKIFPEDDESIMQFQDIEDNGTVEDMIEFIDLYGNEEMLSRYGIRSDRDVKKLAKHIMKESVVNEAEKPLYKKGQKIQYQLEFKGGVGKYAGSISKSKNVETGVIKKRKKTLASYDYELTDGLVVHQSEILGLAESVSEAKASKYPSFKADKAIRYQDMLISQGYWTYMGKERHGKGLYKNVNNNQTYGFDVNDIKYFHKHLGDIEIMD